MIISVGQLLKKGRVFLDGAFGTELLRRGLNVARAELYNVEKPDVVSGIHCGYLSVGSNAVYTNTFGANSLKYPDKALLKEIILNGVKLASAAADDFDAAVIYSAGPLTELIEPFGKLSFEAAYNIYAEQARIIENTGISAVVVETITDTLMLKAAVLAFSENAPFPVWCSMSFDENGRTFNGTPVECYALIAEGLGVKAVGINCSVGADKMYNNAKRLTECVSTPVFIKPNAGIPVYKDGKPHYDATADEFAADMLKIAELGIPVLGGCCGTDPEYIAKTIALTKDVACRRFDNSADAVCSATKRVLMQPHMVIGERVNPTGKPLLKQALREGDFDYVASMCVSQSERGADILDLNAGMSGIDEASVLTNVVKTAQRSTVCPLQIDTTRPDALERALRNVNGLPVINSVNGDEKSLETVLPLAKKYGAYVIALCLDENGIPDSVEGRLAVADKILNRAKEYGIDKSKLLFDALTLAVSVNADNAKITLQTVNALKNRGLKSVLGLSNISYGLPARDIINNSFYAMAREAGLFAAIVNPSATPETDIFALDLLNGNDEKCERYIKKYSGYTAEPTIEKEQTIFDCVLKGLRAEGLAAAKKRATADNYEGIIKNDVIAALDELGKLYDCGKVFLPQLISSADCASAVLDYIKTQFLANNSSGGKVMLLATVKGDVHDIGKNIVKAVLSNYGYDIIDLGRDVSLETLIDAVEKYRPEVVGLSALMTTTLDSMKTAVQAIKDKYPKVIVAVGGAVVTQEFASSIGADVYACDASDAVKKLSAIFT